MAEMGPYLKAAAFCGDVIEDKDGVLSLIRVVDRLIVTAEAVGQQQPPPSMPKEMPKITTPLKLVLMFISGRARGTQGVDVKMQRPDGTVHDLWSGTVFLEGEDRGANVIVNMQIEFGLEGLYWFHISLDDSELTRMPFRLIYQRAVGGTSRR